MQANIFNIQKFSIHDGPGLRTTVFFKGCPLRCKWCSNPESQNNDVQILRHKDKCSRCFTCYNVCPVKAIDKQLNIDANKCIKCFTCVSNCLNRALEAKGEMLDVDTVVSKCLQDIDFYIESNGGVTLSGGECLNQVEFVSQLIDKLHEHQIHVAVETCGYVEHEIFHNLTSKLDLVIIDCKHYDRNKHYEETGVYNDLIIDNIIWLINNKIPHLVRIPVIPTFNSELEDAYGFVNKFKEISVNEVQLLPFHQFGEKKYELLNKEYSLKDKKALYKEDLLDYQKVFIDNGINCYF